MNEAAFPKKGIVGGGGGTLHLKERIFLLKESKLLQLDGEIQSHHDHRLFPMQVYLYAHTCYFSKLIKNCSKSGELYQNVP